MSDIPLSRLVSMIVHATGGAMISADDERPLVEGILKGLFLESVANSRWADTLAGSVAVGVGYGWLALDAFNIDRIFDGLKRDPERVMDVSTELTPTKYVYDVETGEPAEFELVHKESGWTYERKDGYVPPPEKELAPQVKGRRPISRAVRELVGE